MKRKHDSQPLSADTTISLRILALIYLCYQIGTLVKGFITHDIRQNLVVPLAILTVLLAAATVWLAFAVVREYRQNKKEEAELLKEGKQLLQEEEEKEASPDRQDPPAEQPGSKDDNHPEQ